MDEAERVDSGFDVADEGWDVGVAAHVEAEVRGSWKYVGCVATI